jgi:hypothetical protein
MNELFSLPHRRRTVGIAAPANSAVRTVVAARVAPIALAAAVRAVAVLAVLFALVPAGRAAAQSPEWSATLMAPAFPSPFLSEWERNPQNLTLTVLHAGTGNREYLVEGILREARRGELARAESPPLFIDGPSTATLTAADLPLWRTRVARSADIDNALRVGSIPEGDYEICVRILTTARVQLARDCVLFSITLPDAPELVFPGAGDVIPTVQPTFQWTPVLLPPAVGVTYRLRIVPRHEGQSPYTAILANLPHLDTELTGVPFFLYPADALPLEPGTEYVWQVEALDAMGDALVAGGLRSQVWTFRPTSAMAPPPIIGLESFPDTLELVPGVARLVGLRGTEIVETAFGYTLNGDARLETMAPYGTLSRARLQDVVLDNAGGPLRVTAGRVVAQLDGDALPASARGSYAQLDRLEFTPETGLTIHGRLQLPGMPDVALRGAAQWTAVGLYGELSGSGALGTMGGDPVALRLLEARLRLPSAELELTAGLDVFGADARCSPVGLSVAAAGDWSATAVCSPQQALPLAPGSGRANVQLHNLFGQLTGSLGESRFEYDLSANASLALDAATPGACSAQLGLSFADGAVGVRSVSPNCAAGSGDVALGWMALRLSNLRVERFTYEPGTGFGFAVRVDAEPSVRSMPALRLPTITDIELTRDGLSFPAVDMTPVLSTVELQGYRLRVMRAAVPGFRLGWDAWTAGTTGDAAFDLGLEVSLPHLPVSAPACLAASPLPAATARLAAGRLSVELATYESPDPTRCRFAIAPDVVLEIERIGGSLAVDVLPVPAVTGDVLAHGALLLPPSFECTDPAQRRMRLGSGVGIGPRGEVRGEVTGLAPGCPIDLGAIAVTLTDATLVLDGAPDSRTARLTGGGRGEFAARQPVNGTGTVTIDLVAGRITDGSLAFQGPMQLDLPRAEPLLSFTLNAAVLDAGGLRVDGRNALLLPDGGTIGTTFDRVVFDPAELRLRAGRVLFDSEFGLQAVLAADGGIGWTTVAGGSAADFDTGARVMLPATVALDTTGLTVSGAGAGRLRYDGRDLAELDAGFNGGFTVAVTPTRVTDGMVELRQNGTLLAHIDATGFHANLAYLGNGLIPDRLGLPSTDVAYLQLRNEDGSFNVLTETTPDGIRVYSAPGRSVPLAFPALALDGGASPVLSVTLDLTLDPLGEAVIAGGLQVDVPAGQATAFDLRRHDIPFAVTRVSYGAGPAGVHELRLNGQLLLWDGAGEPVELTLTPGGRLAGAFQLARTGRLPLVGESARLEYAYDALDGSFNIGLLAGPRQWQVEHTGTLRVALGEGEPHSVAATLRASDEGVAFTAIAAGVADEFRFFDAGPVRLGVANVSVPRIEYTPGGEYTSGGWDFDIELDLSLSFPELGGIELPPVRRLVLDRTGFEIPQVRLAELQASAFEAAGFSVTPLAFRMDALRVNPFDGSLPDDWGFAFDLELGFRDLADDAPAALRSLRLSALDVGYRNGRFIGGIEARLLEAPIVMPIGGDGMAINLLSVGGRLANSPAEQRIELDGTISWSVPDFMRCDAAADTWVAVGEGTFTLNARGELAGRATDLVPPCPLRLDPLALRVTRSDLAFAYVPGQPGSAVLQLDGAVRLPGPVDGDTISAAGTLAMDLVGRRIVDGAIDITQPFRWNLPADQPLLRFVVNSARLDTGGLTLSGDGELRVDGDAGVAGVAVAFDGLRMDLAEFRVRGGSATFATGFALDAAVSLGGINWTARAEGAARPAQDGFRFSVSSGLRLSGDGLQFPGQGSADLVWADDVFPSLGVTFDDAFRLAYDPARVADGRASFRLDGSEIAYLDSRGFWPGDVLGVLPVPARLLLPTEAVAYIQLRDPTTDALLVQAGSTPDGLRLSGTNLQLVVPALAGTAVAPTITINLDNVLVNPGTFALIGGVIEVTGPNGGAEPLFDLAGLGLPLDVRRLHYANPGGGYRLAMDARLRLPAVLSTMPVDVTNVVITEQGLAGQARLGSYRAGYTATEAPLATLERGDLGMRVRGALIDFGAGGVELAGALTLSPFRDQAGVLTPVPFTAATAPDGSIRFAATADSLAGGVLHAGPATFRPQTIAAQPGLQLVLDATDVTVRLGGEFRLPSLNDRFAVTVAGLEVGTRGVQVPDVTLAEEQQFELFGGTFTLKSFAGSPDAPLVLAYSAASRVFTLTMSGEVALPFLNSTPRFRGLRIATNGTFSLAHASLITEPVVMVPQVLTLASLDITNARLRASLDVVLPAPLQRDSAHRVQFSIGADGSVDGGGTIVLVDNAAGPGTRLGVATAHLRYLDLDLSVNASGGRGTLRAIGDLDVMHDAGNRITLGYRSGGAVYPGLRVDFGSGVTWGNIGMARDSVRLGVELLNLTLRQLALTGSPSQFTLGVGGRLSFAIPAVSGGLEFEGFRIGSGLQADFNGMSVTGGHLGIANVVSMQLQQFAFSAGETTIRVPDGTMPTSNSSAISSGTRDVRVSSYATLGGSIGVGPGCGGAPSDCLFAGGVDQIQFYRTVDGGRTHFVVRGAEVVIGDMLEMKGDLLYREGATSGFELMLGASATLMKQYGGTVVGVFDNTEPELRAGLFVAVNAAIPLAPPLVLAEAGGGFFYNARPSHLALVQTHAGLGTTSASFSPPAGKFTGLIYGNVTIASEEVASARVLLTVSEINARLQGSMVMLPRVGLGGTPLVRGDMDLVVGFRKKYAEGNFSLKVAYGPLLDGNGNMEFYVYGPDAWGVFGDGDLKYLSLVNGQAEFFVGAPGFLVAGNLSAGFDFWVVAVRGELDAAMWWQRQPLDLGAYMSVTAEASLLGGALSGSGTLRGALVGGGGSSPLVYAGALAKGCMALAGCIEANIWAKFQDGTVKGGFGSDPVMNQIIARANGVRNGMYASRDAVQSNVAEGRPAPDALALSGDDLVQLYQRLQRLDPGAVTGIFGNGVQREENYRDYSVNWTSEKAHYDWYRVMAAGVNAPRLTPSQDYDLRAAVGMKLNEIKDMQPAINQQLVAVRADLVQLQQLAAEPWPESPVRAASFDRPQTRVTVDADGNEVKEMESGPGFDVNATAAAAARDELDSRRQRTDALVQQVRQQVTALENGLGSVRGVFLDTGPYSLSRFASLHAQALTAAEEQYARQGDVILRRQDWLRAATADLTSRQSTLRNFVTQKTQRMGAANARGMARQRLWTLEELAGNWDAKPLVLAFDATAASLPANDPWFSQQADTLGMQLWYHLARLGMQVSDTAATSAFQWVRSERERRLAAMWLQHAALTARLNALSTDKAELVGSLYDLYDRYAFWLSGTDEEVMPGLDAERTRVTNRLAQLQNDLRVPSVTMASVIVQNQGYMAREWLLTGGSHPSGAYEYLYHSSPGQTIGFGLGTFGMLSGGRTATIQRYALTPARGTTSEARTLRVGMRGGAGYVGLGRSLYSTTYESGGGGVGSVTTTVIEHDASAPTTPTVEILSGEAWLNGSAATLHTADASRIEVRWKSADSQSSIAEFEYAVGTATDRTAVRDWTSAGGRTSMAIHGLELRTNALNYIHVRARNGSGVWSSIGRSAAIRYDTTPPVFVAPAAFRVLAAPTAPANVEPDFATLNSAARARCSLPTPTFAHQSPAVFQLAASQQGPGTAPTPFITIEAPGASDPQSGVARYMWRLDAGSPAGEYHGTGWAELDPNTRAVVLEGQPLDFTREHHLSVVAINRAGLASQPVVHSFRLADPTAPVATRFCVLQSTQPGRLQLGFSSAADDPESGIAGYQYRIRRDDGTIIRDWPAAMDFEAIDAGTLVMTSEADLQDGERFHVDVRVTNGRGTQSIVSSGPIRIDYSAPPQPSIDAVSVVTTSTILGTQHRLAISVVAPNDPHSGLWSQHHQWSVHETVSTDGRRLSTTPAAAGTVSSMQATAGPYTTQVGSMALTDLLGRIDPTTELELRFRTFNQAGIPSTVHTVRFTVRDGMVGATDTGKYEQTLKDFGF